MTEANQNIQSALNKHLSNMTPTMAIAWENVNFVTPTTIGTPYLRSWLLPGKTTGLTLGPNSFDEYLGIFQIDCLYPIGQGWYDCKAKAGAICTHFKKGTLITYNNIEVRTYRVYPDSGDPDGEYYKVSVSIEYKAFTNS